MHRKIVFVTGIIATAIFSTVTPSMAEEAEKPTAALDVGAFSKYVWRGLELSKDSVVIQPSMTVGYKGASVNLWGNLDTDNEAYDGAKYNETDVTVAYATTLGPVKVGGGYIYYGLDGLTDSQEIYGSIGLVTLLNPTITVYKEIAHVPAWYINVGISHSQELMEKITLDVAASAGYYHSEDSGFAEAGNPTEKYQQFHNGLISLGLTIPFAEYFAVKPVVSYSFPITDKAEEYIESVSLSDESSFFYGGVTLSMAF
jgi:Bacterial protein of unknown function (Gcw_chp)